MTILGLSGASSTSAQSPSPKPVCSECGNNAATQTCANPGCGAAICSSAECSEKCVGCKRSLCLHCAVVDDFCAKCLRTLVQRFGRFL